MVHCSEEGLVDQVAALVEVRRSVPLLEAVAPAFHLVVAEPLDHAVPLQDVVETALVTSVVVSGAPATHRVADELPVLLGLREVLEHELWPPLAVAVDVVGEVDDVSVGDVVDVLGMEAQRQEAAGDPLVP